MLVGSIAGTDGERVGGCEAVAVPRVHRPAVADWNVARVRFCPLPLTLQVAAHLVTSTAIEPDRCGRLWRLRD
jgi:hypothetical protein